jgi:chromosomal replication initiator protein
MEKILIEAFKSLGANKRLINFIDRNFLHNDSSTVKILQIIEEAVLKFYDSNPTEIYLTRKRNAVYKRQIMHWLGRKHTHGSLTLIGDVYGMKDHCTVLYSVRTVNNLMDSDSAYRNEVAAVEAFVLLSLNNTELWQSDLQTP